MRFLITGGSGFLGTNLTRKLIEKGEKNIRILDIVEPIDELKNKVDFVKQSILEKDKISDVFRGVDIVIHAAALVPLTKAGKGFNAVNVEGTRNIMEAAKKHNVKKVVHISSSSVYDLNHETMPMTEESKIDPIGEYGKAKYEGEKVVHKFMENGLNCAIIRPRTIVGLNRAGIFQILYEWISEDKTIYVIGDGQNKFQLVSESDLCEAIYLAAVKPESSGEIFNIGNDDYGTFDDLINDVINHAKSKSRIKHINAWAARNSLRLLDKMNLSPLADWHYLTIDKSFYFDTTKAKKLLGWEPKDSNTDMVIKNYEWYIKHIEETHSKNASVHRGSPKQKILGLVKRVS